MSLDKCLSTLQAAGKIDPGREEQARKIYEEIRAAIGDELGADEAAAKATQRALERLKNEAAEKRRQTLLQASRQREIMGNLRDYRDSRGREDWAAAAVAHIESDGVATFSNIEGRRKAVLGQLHGTLTDFLATFRRDLLGRVRQDADLEDVIRYGFREEVKNPSARELGEAFDRTSEQGRLRFNQAGGHIPKRNRWGITQTHSMMEIRKAGFADWRAFTMEHLDPSEMYDNLTGRPLGRAEVEKMLPGIFETVTTAGWNNVEPSGVPLNGKMANRRADPRLLVFKSADAWLAYHKRFGEGDLFDLMLGHIDGMARDIAAMEVLGPNPAATLRWMEQMIQKQGTTTDAKLGGQKRENAAKAAIKRMRDMYALYSGRASSPVSTKWARGFAGGRNVIVSALLGRAAISAVTDLSYQRVAAQFAGLPMTGILKRYVKLFRPTVNADQKLAVRSGLVAENWATLAVAQQRYATEVTGPEFARRLADFTMRASFLSPWTQAGKWAFGMEFMGFLADQRRLAIDNLPAPLARTLQRYGFSGEEWDIIRKTPLFEHEKATFLRPDDLARRTDVPQALANDLATRMLEMIQQETEYAIPGATLRGRATLLSDTQPGTFAGEMLRSLAQFKNFPVSVITMQMQRMMSIKGAMGKAAYGANLVISTALMGYFAYQMKQVASGKTPIPFTEENWKKLVGASVLQGGTLGLYGDYLFGDTNRHDRNIEQSVAGPVVGALADTQRLTVGNLMEAAQGKKTNAGVEALDYAGRYSPGGNIWYLDLAYQRVLLDQLRKEVDPNYQEAFRRMEAKARKEMDQEYWWAPGEMTPS